MPELERCPSCGHRVPRRVKRCPNCRALPQPAAAGPRDDDPPVAESEDE